MASEHEQFQAMGSDMKAHNEAKYVTAAISLKLNALRRMRDVRRLAGFFTLRDYSVAEHCLYTGLLFMEMADMHDVEITEDEIYWVFCHDALEVATGDLLYPVKHLKNTDNEQLWDRIEANVADATPELSRFSETYAKDNVFSAKAWELFRACDALELWLCCREERARKNELANLDGTLVEITMKKVIDQCSFEYIKRIVDHEC